MKIGFIGLGLIGGSLAKKIKQNNPDINIIATTGNIATIKQAYDNHLIDNNIKLDLYHYSDCDYIFLCAPVEKNIAYLSLLKPIIKEECIITDVGSTKGKIHQEVSKLGLDCNFIGGHPMTGSEKTGLKHAKAHLFENAYYIITPTSKTSELVLQQFQDFVKSLDAIPLVLNPQEHDYATAAISHLPHLIAYSLVNLIKDEDNDYETMKTIAAGGFKDITRIASSSPIMWENICSSNQEAILKLLNLYINKLTVLGENIANNNHNGLIELFQTAKDYRDSIHIPSKKHASIVHEIYLDLLDEAGGIATIATILANENINIKNIGIINNREFEEGVLRIEFYDANAKELSETLLTEKNYVIHKR